MKKIKKIIIVSVIFVLAMYTKTFAATTGSFSTSCSKSTLNVGETATVSINASNCEGKFTITSSNANVVSVGASSIFAPADGNAITITAKGAGTATITVTAQDVSDNQAEPEFVTGSKTISVTVNAPVKEEPKQNPPANTTPQNQTPTQQPTNNTPAQQPANNTPAQQQKQEPQVTYQAVNDTIYTANGTINIRSGPSTSYSVVGSLAKDQPLTRTGIGSDGWDKVMVNGSVAYINHALITTAKPEEEPKEEEKSVNKSLKELKVEGYEIVKEAHENGIEVLGVPGCSAVINALSISLIKFLVSFLCSKSKISKKEQPKTSVIFSKLVIAG